MSSAFVARHAPVAQRIEQVSGIRPVTLLIASGIVLVIAILIATGLAANELRWKALSTTESELARIDSVLAAASNRSLNVIDAQLADIADSIPKVAAADLRDAAAAPQIAALLRSKIGRVPGLAAVAVIAANGAVLDRAGAWPTGDIALPELPLSSHLPAGRASSLGAPIRDPQTGAVSIVLMHRVMGLRDAPLGAVVVGIVQPADLANLFAAVPLPADATIVLLGSDGTVLTRYPERAGSLARIANEANLGTLFDDTTATMVHQATSPDGSWRIEALRALADYPAAVVVSRNATQALAGWAHERVWFAGFALVVSAAIGVMVYLIARQFQIHGALATSRAETIEAERARLAAEAELLKTERLSVLGQLTATVAHELRNPLSAIRNTLFTVKELATAAGIKLDRPIARMERSIERCDRIISDLLEYTRTRELKRTGVRFDSWVAEVVNDQNISPPMVVTTELGAGEVEVLIDSDRMRRVIINLVENAVHALGALPPDREKRITLRTEAVDSELSLVITDTGSGIAPDTLERIFEPLFSTKSFGTGLGLPTVKQIINQHGGIIAVDSEVGKGTRVTVRLPLETENTEAVRVAA